MHMMTTKRVDTLIGKSIELICFAQYSVYIHLQDRITLTVHIGFEHSHGRTTKVHQLSSPLTESSLMSILESTITSAIVESDGDLILKISNGDTLRIYKDPNFESYRLNIGGEELIA
jgi:hypothetical protein